jgi:uncharacterized lipoprotein YajG
MKKIIVVVATTVALAGCASDPGTRETQSSPAPWSPAQ